MNRIRPVHRIRLLSAIGAAVIALLAACQDANLTTGPEHLTPSLIGPPGLGASIVFTKLSESQDQNELERAEIYIMNADGSDQRRITHNDYIEINADLSPDGNTVVFHQQRGALCCFIALVNADGTNERTLTNGMWPRWSPNG